MEYKTKDRIVIIHCAEIYHMLISRLWLLLLIGVIGAGAGLAYERTDRPVPMYKATTKMYVTGMETAGPTSAGFNLGQQVITNYIEIIKSRPVLEQVIGELQLNMNYGQLLSCVSFRTPAETSMLEVSVAFPDAQWSKTVVDRLVEVSAERAETVMGSSHPRVYEESYLPDAPYNISRTRSVKFVLAGAVGGGGLTVFLIMLAYLARGRFSSPDQVEEVLKIPVLCMLTGKVKGKNRDYREESLKTFYRRFNYFCGDSRVLSFASLSGEERRCGILREVSDYLCSLGKSVICVDGNLYRPEWGSGMREEEDVRSLEDYLEGKARPEEIIRAGEEGEADYIRSGEGTMNSLELLRRPELKLLLDTLKQRYDYIFIDTPPARYIPDSMVLNEASDGVIWVVSSEKTPVGQARRMKTSLEEGGRIRIAGVILDEVSTTKNRRHLLKVYGDFFGIFDKKSGKRR